MFIFAILIVLSIVMYIYYKVGIFRTTDELKQRYLDAKSRICLGVLLISMAINQYITIKMTIVLIISIIFLILGIMQLIYGFNASRHYSKEWRRLNE